METRPEDMPDTVLFLCDNCDEEYQVPESTRHCPICGKRGYSEHE